jgi:hypothetical protein
MVHLRRAEHFFSISKLVVTVDIQVQTGQLSPFAEDQLLDLWCFQITGVFCIVMSRDSVVENAPNES